MHADVDINICAGIQIFIPLPSGIDFSTLMTHLMAGLPAGSTPLQSASAFPSFYVRARFVDVCFCRGKRPELVPLGKR